MCQKDEFIKQKRLFLSHNELYVSYCFSRPRGRKRDEGFSTAETKVFTEPQARSKSWVEAVEKPEWAFFCPEDYSKSSENTIFHHTQRFFTLFCPRIHFSALGLQNLTRPGLKNLFSLSWFRKNAERDEKVLPRRSHKRQIGGKGVIFWIKISRIWL